MRNTPTLAETKQRLERTGQEHLLAFWDSLDDARRAELLGAIATLPRTVTRIEERLPEPLVINQANLNEARNRSAHMFFRVSGGDQALFKTLARARCAAERACSCLQYIGGLCRCSAGFLRFRVAATRHDAPLLRFGSDGGGNLKRRRD